MVNPSALYLCTVSPEAAPAIVLSTAFIAYINYIRKILIDSIIYVFIGQVIFLLATVGI